MDYRPLGRTGLNVSVLGFGAGNVGGLMVRGEPAERVAAVRRAIDAGINYFDTAALYGDGLSEQHLGEALMEAGADVYVGTKVRVSEAGMADIGGYIARSMDESLQRLGRDNVTLIQLHNHIGGGRGGLTPQQFEQEAIPALERLVTAGKARFFGITALGDTGAVKAAINAGRFYTAQVGYNLINPTAGIRVPAAEGSQDFEQLAVDAQAAGVGCIGIRVLAAGALSGTADRHPVAVPSVAPIASGPDYQADVDQSHRFEVLVQEGYVSDLVEASVRFARSNPAISTALVGLSEIGHLETAIKANEKGDLTPQALERLQEVWEGKE